MQTAPRPRHQRRKEARPAEIMAAALKLFSERGFAAARLEDVAAAYVMLARNESITGQVIIVDSGLTV